MKNDKIIVLLIFILFCTYVSLNLYKSSQEREKYRLETICYINNTEVRRSFNHIEGYFYYKGKKYESYANVDNNPKRYLGKYYKVVFSSKDPNNYEILYNAEITDVKKIKDAGF